MCCVVTSQKNMFTTTSSMLLNGKNGSDTPDQDPPVNPVFHRNLGRSVSKRLSQGVFSTFFYMFPPGYPLVICYSLLLKSCASK